MTEQELRLISGLVEAIKEDTRLKDEQWQSLTYWDRGVGASLRRFRHYGELLRISRGRIDFHLYIGLSDNLAVFKDLIKRLPGLAQSLRTDYQTIEITYETEPARNPDSQKLKKSMAMAHFYIPLECTEMLKDVYAKVYDMSKDIAKGKEVEPNGPRNGKESVDKLAVVTEEVASTKVHLRPIPVGVAYPEDVAVPCKISGVVSWVTSIGALFDRKAITLSDGRTMRPGQYIIPPYQRKYTWSYDNVSQLCRDLIKSKDAGKENYHLGTIILHHQEGDDGDSFYVVDGQQRLTTISYLINCEIFEKGVSSPKIKDTDIKNILSALEEYRDEKKHLIEQLKRSTLVVIAVSDINEAFQLFSTQNGRGKPLTPANLLKAYHLHELDKSVDAAEKDRVWESDNAEKTVRDGRLLSQVLGEHLYRLRCWSRGEFPKGQFSNADIKEFKGVTFNDGNEVGVPAQNLMRLRQRALADGKSSGYYSRLPNDKMYALATIDQPIINGADFFKYVESYAEAYRVLFGSSTAEEVVGFRKFYEENCNYRRSDRRGDTYARHVFESLCLFCYDRFGVRGLDACKSHLYRCAYYERAVKSRCYYCTCGLTFTIPAVRVMSSCVILADVKDRLRSLSGAVLESYRKEMQAFAGKSAPEGVDCVRMVYEN